MHQPLYGCAQVGIIDHHSKRVLLKRALLSQARRLSGEAPWQGILQLRKRKDHFITTVESIGVLPAKDLVLEALQVLQDKCDQLLLRL